MKTNNCIIDYSITIYQVFVNWEICYLKCVSISNNDNLHRDYSIMLTRDNIFDFIISLFDQSPVFLSC